MRRGADAWLQYWTFYPDNPQDRGIFRTGRHVGDWEVVQFRLSDGRPRSATYARHAWAETCPWSGARPEVFVSSGSHAAYFSAGRHERPWPDPNDHADGERAVPARVEPLGDWADWPGRWGPTREGWVPGEQSSPRSPAFQGMRWDDPAAFERTARACGSAPPWQWTETATPWVLLLGIAAAAVGLKRRQRRRA